MDPLRKETLEAICRELAAHRWDAAELDELVEPRLGIITGFQDLLRELEDLRREDLGAVAPAQGLRRRDPAR
jgi:hypothetical protein